MFTDMVGYTALGQKNESLSLALMEEQRKVIRPILARHYGREVKTIGDAFLVEFPNALDAVRCAYDIQRAVKEFNISMPSEQRLHLRIGVHDGDVVESNGDISGDAVNVASRIEPLAEDGGVCLTQEVYNHVRNKFELPLSSMGPKTLKNVAEPVEVYRMVMPWDKETSHVQLDKNRIAILPFANMSPDPSDEYFADGMTEELIDRLAQVKSLKVIARTSVMSFKGEKKKAADIARELEVGTIVEGSVRKAGNRVRVTVQLISAGREEHLWSSHYDGTMDDVFAVQSEIAEKVVGELKVQLLESEKKILEKKPTENTEAYADLLRARTLLRRGTETSIKEAIGFLENATAIDRNFARAYSDLAWCHILLGFKGLLGYNETLAKGREMVGKALSIDEDLAEAHAVMSAIAWIADDRPSDEMEARRAIELSPSMAQAYEMLALVRASRGYPKESIGLLELAHQLDPLSPSVIDKLAEMYLYTGKMADAKDFLTKNLQFAPREATAWLATYHITRGEYDKAGPYVESLERNFPEALSTVLARGQLAAFTGDREAAQKCIARMQTEFNSAQANKMVGFVLYFLGDVDGFFTAMFRDVENHTLDPVTLRYSPLLAKAREDPRYREVMMKGGENPDVKE
jgi:adenylate cyclase